MAEKKKLSTDHNLYFVALKPEEDDARGRARKRLVAQLDRTEKDELYIQIGDAVYYASFSQVETIMKYLSDGGLETCPSS
jgi:tartrate dehydratase beta subunit/fumarate hydratase class I family protein